MGLFTRAGRQDLSGPGRYFGGTAANATQSGALFTMGALNTSAMRGLEASGLVPRDSNRPTGHGFGGAFFIARSGGGELAGAGDGDAAAAGSALAARTLEGSSAGEAAAVADLATRSALAGTAASAASTTAAMSTIAALAANAPGAAAASASLALRIPLAGAASASSTTAATLSGQASMDGTSSPFSTLSPETLAAAVLAANVEGDVDVAESLRLHNAVLGGKVTDAGTGTERFRDLADTKDRVVAVVDGAGNRTSVVRDLG